MQWRLVVTGVCFLGLTVNYASRASMGIVSSEDGAMPLYGSKGAVLGAFLLGYACTNFPSGLLSRRLGAKPVLLLSALLLALCDGLTPLLAGAGLHPLLLLRLGAGVGAGLFPPALVQLTSRWLPASERATLMTFVISGANLGPTAAMVFSPGLMRVGGAVAAFGCWALAMGAWGGLSWLLLASTPAEHKACCKSGEAEFIQQRTGAGGGPPLRLAQLLREPSCWGVLFGQVGFDYGWQLLLNWLPSYLVHLGLDLARYPLLAALPYLCGWLGANSAGWAVDAALRRRSLGLRRRHATKAAQFLGAFCSALLLCLSALMPGRAAALAFLLLALFCFQWQMAGFVVATMDVCPGDAGTFMGMANTASMLAGALAQPLVDGVLLRTGSWLLAMATAGAGSLAGALLFVALADDQDVAAGKSAAGTAFCGEYQGPATAS